MNNVPSDFTFNFNEEQQKRKAREDDLYRAFWNQGYWVDTHEASDTLLNIAEEFNMPNAELAHVWLRFPNGCTQRRAPPGRTSGHDIKYTISQATHKFDEFRAFLRNLQREHEKRQAQAELHTSRLKPYQYVPGYANNSNGGQLPPSCHYEGIYGEYGAANGNHADGWKLVQGRAMIDKLFDLVERAEKAEEGREKLLEELRGLRADFGGVRRPADNGNADNTLYTACLVEHTEELKTTNYSLVEHAEKAELGREKTVLGLERLLEELRGLRLELGSLRRPANSNADRAFYIACACLGVLILMLFFK